MSTWFLKLSLLFGVLLSFSPSYAAQQLHPPMDDIAYYEGPDLDEGTRSALARKGIRAIRKGAGFILAVPVGAAGAVVGGVGGFLLGFFGGAIQSIKDEKAKPFALFPMLTIGGVFFGAKESAVRTFRLFAGPDAPGSDKVAVEPYDY